ncbi:PQQ-dependent sugar dehydrogenase [Telluribacter sp. SYSU D00476]|uniref:PQQ-dependent sugar dehydrogenase n=1 Tax=Telluribacter sp. SYSU D00476 TaxID=2811430 RepID=UPI001FF2B670|nr:PQQ-dependent sugar dehydrogenase [Telluribacter sp. SYSU D00476]
MSTKLLNLVVGGGLLLASFTAPQKPLSSLPLSIEAIPDSSRFTHMMLAQGLDEPMEMAILPNLNVVIVERKGGVRMYDAQEKQLKTLAHLNVFSGIEDGLLGVAIDPDYTNNSWIYFFYGVGGDKAITRLSRMELRGDQLLQSTEKVLLEFPTQRKYCCHSAGYLRFDTNGNLFISTGDNTNAEETEGYTPVDERPGRELSDDQATAANTNDLRGKILRIKPQPDGSYSIPDGNLFPKDGSKGRPEIYIMGSRNPFRVSIDPKNGYVYWGDVGPDTKVPSVDGGVMSFDEINQARKPGFFGWPYFLGNNEAFPKYDFATKKEGPRKDPLRPINDSPNNTGIRELPPAQPPMIWYAKGESKRFPLVGKGGASAMAGPVYYSDLYPNAPYKLPDYYNGKLFIYDWIRKWIMAVTLDENGNYASMEPFLPHLQVVAPMDMQIAHDGAVYLLAYGTNWFAKSADAGLIRVEYTEGNRNPLASIKASQLYGAAPLTVTLSGADSKDHDPDDKLSFEWKIGTKKVQGKEVKHTFTKPGVYDVALTAADQHGGMGVATVQIKVGNTPPDARISTSANQSFYWDNTVLDYKVAIKDPEDKQIDPARATVSFTYLPFGKDIASAVSGATHGNIQHAEAEKLYASLDCRACHTMDSKSIGPSLKDIAKRYNGKAGAVEALVDKVIKGGSGNWGAYAMSAHPDLPVEDSKAIVNYILSLDAKPSSLPLSGKLKLTDHVGKGNEGAYVLLASYQDKGANGIEPLTARTHMVLRNPKVEFEDYEGGNVGVVIATEMTGFISYIRRVTPGRYVSFNKIDLTHIKSITYRLLEEGTGGTLEVRLGRVDGPLVSSLQIPAGKAADYTKGWKDRVAPVMPTKGVHDLYFVFKNESGGQKEMFFLDWMQFNK